MLTLTRYALASALTIAALSVFGEVATAHEPGPGFGRHIATMAPEHPREHGAHFGECVSAMATTGECTHAH